MELLTNIIPVNHSILSDAAKSSKRYAHDIYVPPITKHHTTSSLTHDVTHGVAKNLSSKPVQEVSTLPTSTKQTRVFESTNITLLYDDAMSDFNATRHATEEDAQMFYLNYCLLPFLMSHNKHIKNYIA
jgi:hypothetical protein